MLNQITTCMCRIMHYLDLGAPADIHQYISETCAIRVGPLGQQLIRALQLCRSHLMTLMWEIDIHASPNLPSTRACCLLPKAIRHQTETATYLNWRYNTPLSVFQHNQKLSKHFWQGQFQRNTNKGVWIHQFPLSIAYLAFQALWDVKLRQCNQVDLKISDALIPWEKMHKSGAA